MISAHDCPIVAILIEIADMTMLTPGRSVLECPCCHMKDSLSSHFGQLSCWVRSHASNALVIASTSLVSRCHIVLLCLFSGHDLILYLHF